MRNKTIVYVLMTLLLLSFALGAKPIKDIVQSGNLIVESASPIILQYNSNAELYFHAYNSSGGYLNATRSNCTFHFYNVSNGQHLVDEQVLATHNNKNEWEWVVNWSKVTTTGEYTYIVNCKTVGQVPLEEGYLRGEIIFTKTGEAITWEAFILAGIWIVLPLLVAWLMLTWALALGEEHAILKIFISLFSVISVIFSYVFSILTVNKFFDWTQMSDVLNISLITSGAIAFVLLTYWAIYLLKLAFKAVAVQKAERLNY